MENLPAGLGVVFTGCQISFMKKCNDEALAFCERALHADHRAARCYCLIVSSTGNTQELSMSADEGIACLL